VGRSTRVERAPLLVEAVRRQAAPTAWEILWTAPQAFWNVGRPMVSASSFSGAVAGVSWGAACLQYPFGCSKRPAEEVGFWRPQGGPIEEGMASGDGILTGPNIRFFSTQMGIASMPGGGGEERVNASVTRIADGGLRERTREMRAILGRHRR